MPLKVLTLAFDPKQSAFPSAELEVFCANKRILAYKSEFFVRGDTPFWSFLLEYEPLLEPSPAAKRKENNPPALSEAEMILFDQLRAWRKEKAETEGVPVYVIANNSHLEAMVKERILTISGLEDLRGFGKKKVQAYGKELLTILQTFFKDEPAT